MKNYTITVNGTTYQVSVEEAGGSTQAAPAARVPAAAPPKAAPAAAPKKAVGGGAVKVTASVPGKVFKVESSIGQSIKSGDTIIILEAMKMEIPVVAPQDGTIASIEVSVGQAIESGDVLATLN